MCELSECKDDLLTEKKTGRGAHVPVPIIHVDESYPGRGSEPPVALPEPAKAGISMKDIARAKLSEKRKLAKEANKVQVFNQRNLERSSVECLRSHEEGDEDHERLNWLGDDSDDDDADDDKIERVVHVGAVHGTGGASGRSPPRAKPESDGDGDGGDDDDCPRARRYKKRMERIKEIEVAKDEAGHSESLDPDASNAMILYRPKITNLNALLKESLAKKNSRRFVSAAWTSWGQHRGKEARMESKNQRKRKAAAVEEDELGLQWEENVFAPVR